MLNEKLHKLHSRSNIIRVMKLWRTNCSNHVTKEIRVNTGEQYQWSPDGRWKERTIGTAVSESRIRDIRKENIKILSSAF